MGARYEEEPSDKFTLGRYDGQQFFNSNHSRSDRDELARDDASWTKETRTVLHQMGIRFNGRKERSRMEEVGPYRGARLTRRGLLSILVPPVDPQADPIRSESLRMKSSGGGVTMDERSLEFLKGRKSNRPPQVRVDHA